MRILDVSRNQIATPLKELGATVDKLEKLQGIFSCLMFCSYFQCIQRNCQNNQNSVFSIHENPCMKSYADRMSLIGYIDALKKVTCVLRVLGKEKIKNPNLTLSQKPFSILTFFFFFFSRYGNYVGWKSRSLEKNWRKRTRIGVDEIQGQKKIIFKKHIQK